jgi:hypothetical protein
MTKSIARATAAFVVVVAGIVAITLFFSGGSSRRHRWTFLGDDVSPDALGFRVGEPRSGTWSVEHDDAATGARSLVNRVGDDDAPPATLVTNVVRARDLRALTRCRVSPGGACGIVFRYVDDRTHHVARLQTDRVVLARVAGGKERVLGSSAANVFAGIWHELTVEARGDVLRVAWNGAVVIDVHDVVPAPIGTAGLWAPSSGEAYFDELAVDVFPAAAQVVEVLPLLGGRTS